MYFKSEFTGAWILPLVALSLRLCRKIVDLPCCPANFTTLSPSKMYHIFLIDRNFPGLWHSVILTFRCWLNELAALLGNSRTFPFYHAFACFVVFLLGHPHLLKWSLKRKTTGKMAVWIKRIFMPPVSASINWKIAGFPPSESRMQERNWELTL